MTFYGCHAWLRGVVVTRWSRTTQRSCSTLGTVTTLMGDCLLTGKPSRYVAYVIQPPR